MKGTGVAVASVVAAGLLVAAYVAGVGGSSWEARERNRCMSMLATPGVSDPAYNDKSVEFAQGMARCMEGE